MAGGADAPGAGCCDAAGDGDGTGCDGGSERAGLGDEAAGGPPFPPVAALDDGPTAIGGPGLPGGDASQAAAMQTTAAKISRRPGML